MQQMEKALLDVEQGFTTVAIPGNAELHGEVDAARQQEQLHLAQILLLTRSMLRLPGLLTWVWE
jgi:hypothetical protein